MKQQTKDATPSPSNSLAAVIVGKLDCPINEEQTELFHQGQWKEIQEDQDGEKYFMDGMQTVYFEVSPVFPSIPVKEDLLDMTGPHFMGGSAYFQIMPGMISVTFFSKNKQGSENNKYPWYEDEDVEKARLKAKAICTAVNNTYGQSINPESVPAMYRALLPFKLLAQEVLDVLTKDQTVYEYNGAKITTQDLKNVLTVLFKATPNK